MSLNLKFACNQICLNSQRFSLFNEIASRGLRFKYSPNPNNIFRFENKFHTICANDNYSENSNNTIDNKVKALFKDVLYNKRLTTLSPNNNTATVSIHHQTLANKLLKYLPNTGSGSEGGRVYFKWLPLTLQRRGGGDSDGKDGKEGGEKNKDDNNNEKNNSSILTLVTWTLITMYVVITSSSDNETGSQVSWNDFVNEMLAKGEVKSVVVRPEQEMVLVKLQHGAIYKGKPSQNESYMLKMGDFERFEEKLRKAEEGLGVKGGEGVAVVYDRSAYLLPKLLVLFGVLMLLWFLKKTVKFQMPNPTDLFARERKAKFTRVDLANKDGITFKQVAGLHEAKIEIMEFVDYLKRSENYKRLGVKIPKGALLLGPPGCGKTLLAKALATEAKVPFLAMAGSEFVEMLGGLGAARVRDLFKEARNKSPCIVYIDEVDAIGRKRGGDNFSQSSEEEHTLNQLLVEMDGIGTKEGVIVLASTNRAEVLDTALLRAGRFDRHILIDLPTLKERLEIFSIYLRRLKLKDDASQYAEGLAQMSPGMSGADIANICNEAALHAARMGATQVHLEDFDYAVERVIVGVAKKSRVLSGEEKRVVAYHEAGHALIGWMLQTTDQLLKVSIIPRTSQALGFAQYIPRDNKLYNTESLFEQMCLMLGGRVAESLTFNKVTSGAQDDLQKVTKLAYDQVRVYGMNDKVGLVSFPVESEHQTKPYSKNTASLIDQESNLLVARAYQATEKLLQLHSQKLKMIAEALLEKECLDYKEMEQLIGPPPHGHKTLPSTQLPSHLPGPGLV